MDVLSLPLSRMRERYEVVVVGSGYGGSIAASRLARAGRQVCLVERGSEITTGNYPEQLDKSHLQWTTRGERFGSGHALFDFHLHKGMSALVGCGLGGTSLINANVSIKPDARVFRQSQWPAALQAEGVLDPYYALAHAMLRPTPYPKAYPQLHKVSAHRISADRLASLPGERVTTFELADINVNFDKAGPNHVGTYQRPCTNCGNCVSGCNVGAKNTTLMNYLPDACNFGAEIFTRCAVHHVEKRDRCPAGGWRVHLLPGPEGGPPWVDADVVVLAAGTLGSTEIVFRSRHDAELTVSRMLGQGFSGNGDVLAIGDDCAPEIDGVGWRHGTEPDRPAVGPCIVSVIHRQDPAEVTNSWMIEDGAVPGLLRHWLPRVLHLARGTVDPQRDLVPDRPPDLAALDDDPDGAFELCPVAHDPQHAQTLLAMSHDGSAGSLELDTGSTGEGSLRIVWPTPADRPVFAEIDADLRQCVDALHGAYVPDPLSAQGFGANLITVHPLGGCVMADNATTGVVNDLGQVYSGADGTEVHEGLYVADGSIVPTSLGANPLFTISALAERIVAKLAEQRSWTIAYDAPSPTPPQRRPALPGLRLTEEMSGTWAPEAGVTSPGADPALAMTLTIVSDDLERMLDAPGHPARLSGDVRCPDLSPNPLTVENGTFQIFVADSSTIGAKKFDYGMPAVADDGTRYFLSGRKTVPLHPVRRAWHETTTLYVDVHAGESTSGPLLGRGQVQISPADFVRQLRTIEITGVPDATERLVWLERFGRFFVHNLWTQYGGVAASVTDLQFERPPRWRRPLRVAPPTVHDFRTADGVDLRLTRYRGGDKGPVLLAHGLAVSSLIFHIDTIRTNLVEYLCERGYDCWLLDYRCSVALPDASRRPATGDDVARFDLPAAINMVLAETEGTTLQVMAHCYGATTFTMALLGGFVDRAQIRSVVLSQISADVLTPRLKDVESHLRMPTVLQWLGARGMTTEARPGETRLARLYDRALAAAVHPVAQGRCHDPVCHRITFEFGSLYEHDRITRSHDVLHEMFGFAGIEQLRHLARMVRAGHVVAASGADCYLPYLGLGAMQLPICFIHGADNECYLPESTQRTYDSLTARYGDTLYERHPISGYGHIDCMFGDDASRDVYPLITAHLDRYPAGDPPAADQV